VEPAGGSRVEVEFTLRPGRMTTTAAHPTPLETVGPDEAALIQEFIAFLKDGSLKRHPTGPIRRYNQGRHTACVQGELTVLDGLAPELRVGLFAECKSYRAWIRFANASSSTDKERDVRGMSIQLADVPGRNLTEGATTQDFVLNSHPVMVIPDTRAFLELLRAMEAGGLQKLQYLLSHPRALRGGIAARAHHPSHLEIPYWSTTPYLFGDGRAVKYSVRPCAQGTRTPPAHPTDSYLRDAMRAHLDRSEACFDFLVQFQRDPRTMPIEDASVEWSELDSPFRLVARIRIPAQKIDDAERLSRCEEISFNPWHALVEHRPLGGLNRARREIYRVMAEFRHQRGPG
jgi:hypothetical protein